MPKAASSSKTTSNTSTSKTSRVSARKSVSTSNASSRVSSHTSTTKTKAPKRGSYTPASKLYATIGELPESVPLSTAAQSVLAKRYLKVDELGEPTESVQQLFRRVAKNIASGDTLYGATKEQTKELEDHFYAIQLRREFLSGMTLRNAGRKLQQLAACYVLPMHDSMDSIYDTLKNAAFLHKTGAGIGYDFSELRPNGSRISTTGKVASGPVSFMKLIDFSCTTIVNNGAVRGAGNMGILRVDHPDIEEFINAKTQAGVLERFNISVAVTDVFMKAVKEDTTYDLIDPHTKEVARTESARRIWDMIAERAWRSAEPGVLFIDTVNASNQAKGIGDIAATNQCGEQPLLPHESCNLGSVVLSRFVETNDQGEPELNWERLRNVVRLGVHFLDNTIDLNSYLLPEIERMNKGNRRIGLGVMGFADMLYLLKVPYSSAHAVELAEKVMKFVTDEARERSRELAKERGNFPNFKKSTWPEQGETHMRNITTTTIAPTGTTSMFASCSSGIEPVFSLAFVRKNFMNVGSTEQGAEFTEVHEIFEQVAKERWFYSNDLMERIAEAGSIKHMSEIPQDVRDVFETTYDISWEQHIAIQAAFQKYTDNAVSKTINLPESASVEDIKQAYTMLYETHCKGGTIYRDKSRETQVLNLKEAKATQPLATTQTVPA